MATGTPRLTAHTPCHSQGLLWQVSLFLLSHFWRLCVLLSLTKQGLPGSVSLLTAWQAFESEILTQVSVSDGVTGSGEVIAIGKLLLL